MLRGPAHRLSRHEVAGGDGGVRVVGEQPVDTGFEKRDALGAAVRVNSSGSGATWFQVPDSFFDSPSSLPSNLPFTALMSKCTSLPCTWMESIDMRALPWSTLTSVPR